MGFTSIATIIALIPIMVVLGVWFAVRMRAYIKISASVYDTVASAVTKTVFRFLIFAGIPFFLLMALAGPFHVSSNKVSLITNTDVIILNDDSVSTEARADIDGLSRGERAQVIAGALVAQLEGANLAICEFTSKAFCRAPFGSSSSAILGTIEEFGPDAITGSGSRITYALNEISSQFPEYEDGARSRVIVLLSDGGERLTSAYYREELDMVLEHLADKRIRVISIGIGESYPIPVALLPIRRWESSSSDRIFSRDGVDYKIIESSFNEDKLKRIAVKTNGIYIHEDELESQSIDVFVGSSLDRTFIERPVTKSLAWIPLILALACCWAYKLFFF